MVVALGCDVLRGVFFCKLEGLCNAVHHTTQHTDLLSHTYTRKPKVECHKLVSCRNYGGISCSGLRWMAQGAVKCMSPLEISYILRVNYAQSSLCSHIYGRLRAN